MSHYNLKNSRLSLLMLYSYFCALKFWTKPKSFRQNPNILTFKYYLILELLKNILSNKGTQSSAIYWKWSSHLLKNNKIWTIACEPKNDYWAPATCVLATPTMRKGKTTIRYLQWLFFLSSKLNSCRRRVGFLNHVRDECGGNKIATLAHSLNLLWGWTRATFS